MAHIKIKETILSCPNCGRKLLKVPTGGILIGSPFVTCKKCGTTCRTDLRVEWYKYPAKKSVFVIPVLIPVAMLLTGIFMGDAAIGIMAALFGAVFGLCWLSKDLFRIFRSRKRMQDKEYLQRLLANQLISIDDYARFSQAAK